MAQREPEQHKPQEACGTACRRCGESLTPGTKHKIAQLQETSLFVDLDPVAPHNLSRIIAREAWRETAREAAELFPLCLDCRIMLTSGEVESEQASTVLDEPGAAPQDNPFVSIFLDTHLIASAAELLKPTLAQLTRAQGDLHPANVLVTPDRVPYLIDLSLPTATFNRWHEVGHQHYDLLHEAARLGGISAAKWLLASSGKTQRIATALAAHAAHDAWSAAVEVRELYLSPDPTMSIQDRNSAVSEFASTWLGWKANVPQEKTEALIDALLSDDWPSGVSGSTGSIPTLLRGLVRERRRNWQLYDARKINGKSITSHSIPVHTESGEIVKMVDLLAGPDVDFGIEPHVLHVRNALAELDPIEREVCLTYATCVGRKSWARAAQLNGLPKSFGVNSVRRKIKTRLEEHENAGRTGRRASKR